MLRNALRGNVQMDYNAAGISSLPYCRAKRLQVSQEFRRGVKYFR